MNSSFLKPSLKEGRRLVPVFLLAAILWVGCRAHEAAQPVGMDETEAVAVQVKPAEHRPITQAVQAIGCCEAPLNKRATLAPAVEGRVLRILAQPGDAVTKGQPIVQFDPRIAEANLQEKKAARNELLSALALLKALPRPEQQKMEQLLIEEAKNEIRKAEAVIERLQPLLERKEIPRQQMFDAKIALEQARLKQQKAETQFQVLMLGPRPEAVKEAEDRIATAEAAVAAAQTQCDLLTLRSPLDGVLGRITCRIGQTVAPGTPVGDVTDSRQLDALLWLPPHDRRLVRVGQKAQIQATDSVKDRPGSRTPPTDVLAGRVEFVGPVADPQTGNFPARVHFDNPEERFGIGQTVAVAITVREKKDALVVPAKAVFDLEEGALLNVVRGGKSVVLHPQVGIRNKQWVEIQGTDLKAGEPVIVEGGWGLPAGTEVRVENTGSPAERGNQENLPAERGNQERGSSSPGESPAGGKP
jgi:HlyD family secretion protein